MASLYSTMELVGETGR
ncbi:hypothetical protein QC762_111840 [Podospora pseudocomata]|uniref:Uncharacterized protein n=4 Tax=Podospora TaxID=5144 RepID=A0ABR0HZY1_9PEZI|nr:hypothetical protein QC761_111840 [Podospora bellae-mahoneyi]KAK4659606.1 hypothetical protein QC762_111840 [Podospora pseudocomata]KAK4673417.1 hypothetical protein QC763_111840 [Podospora pseudopauciseta]KAK4681919.1 hypothetical protein QC764_111840 [Podospora pseudoanserina]